MAFKRKKFNRSDFTGKSEASVKSSIDRQDSMGAFKSIYKDGISFSEWRPKEGAHCFDIIPYLAGEHDPNTKEGAFSHVLDIWVHRFVGPDNDEHIVCPKRTYKQSCPICKEVQNIQRTGEFDEVELKKLKAKRRTIYNVVVCDGGKEEDKGVQLWDVAHFYMENKIGELARGIPGRGGVVSFPDAEKGKTIAFTIKDNGKGAPPEYSAHQFLDRGYALKDDYLESTQVLDEVITILSYEEIEALYFGSKDKETQEDVDEEEDFEEETMDSQNSVEEDEEEDPLGLDDDEEEDDDDEDEDDDDGEQPIRRKRRR